MNKKIVLLLCVGAAVLAFLAGAVYRTFYYEPSPYDISRNVRDTIQKSLKEQDVEKLYSVFSESSMATREEIEDFFDYVGTVKSLTRGVIGRGGGSVRNGIYTEYSYYGRFEAVMTDGTEYDVYFTAAAFWEEDPSQIGVEDLCFVNKADKYDEYGVGLSYNEKGEALDIYGHEIKEYKRKPRT